MLGSVKPQSPVLFLFCSLACLESGAESPLDLLQLLYFFLLPSGHLWPEAAAGKFKDFYAVWKATLLPYIVRVKSKAQYVVYLVYHLVASLVPVEGQGVRRFRRLVELYFWLVPV